MAYITALITTVVCLSITSYLVWQRSKYRAVQREGGYKSPPQYPHKDPFLGIDLFLRYGKAVSQNTLLEELQQYHERFGKTYQWVIWGSSAISSIEPENIKTVFSTNSDIWGNEPVRLSAMDPWVGRGFITVDGPDWEDSHTLLKPSFRRANITNLRPFENSLQELLVLIPRDGSTVDLQVLFSKLYVDTAAFFLLGETLGCLSGDIPAHGKGFLEAFQYGFQGSGMRIAFGPLAFLIPRKKWYEAIATSHRYVDYYIDKALEYRKKFLLGKIGSSVADSSQGSILLYNIAEKTGDRIYLRNQILQALMAAQDTTANLIGNVFFLLARHAEVWQRLRKEILSVHNNLDYNQLMGLRYLQNVIKEALRLYPVFPQNGRIALRDTKLPVGGGTDGQSPIFIPQGTNFQTSFYTLHRDPRIWGPNADEFRPDRWDTIKPSTWEYVPFGGGPHMCLGQQKATLEASYVVARMLQEFQNIESRDERPWQGQVRLTARNANGCLVSLSPV